jgi:hypothetical protein
LKRAFKRASTQSCCPYHKAGHCNDDTQERAIVRL